MLVVTARAGCLQLFERRTRQLAIYPYRQTSSRCRLRAVANLVRRPDQA